MLIKRTADLGVSECPSALWIENDCHPLGKKGKLRISSSISHRQFATGVGEEIELESFLFLKAGIGLGRIKGNPDDLNP